jgi:hypothetical protein
MAVPPKNSTVGVVTVPHDESRCRTGESFMRRRNDQPPGGGAAPLVGRPEAL